ncbi:MAG: cupin domain-containing protein [Terriglobia bacterium]|nr:cupin domain-containing protein [Terriglobia bacterium]
MQLKRSMEVTTEPIEGVPGVTVRWLWTAKDGAPSFALRLFEIEPRAATPQHSHSHEHEVYVLSGKGLVRGKSGQSSLVAGDTVLVLPHDEHQFLNTGNEPLRFLCAIPLPSQPAK